ncbi:hypothetical protein LJK88_20110 [Paenibacillus sp. P26]|nr:hypothetical protein LJK88_20110 [Paenibacillus sp. P26]
MLQLAPEFAETKDVFFRPGPNDRLVLYNETPCVVEKGGRVFDAAKGKELQANDRVRILLSTVHRSVTVEYIK